MSSPAKKKTALKERYYVWEMKVRDRTAPVRQANNSREPLSLAAAKKLARTGAAAGKRDYAVTASPRSKGAFTVLAQYEAGTGKNITKKVWG